MNLFHKLLGVLIALELVGLGLDYRWHVRSKPRPEIDWSIGLLEGQVGKEIQEMESHFQPDQPEQWLKLAQTYRTFGLFPEAEYCYRQLDARSPKDRSYLYYWAECFDLLGQTEEASKRYLQVLNDSSIVFLGAKTA